MKKLLAGALAIGMGGSVIAGQYDDVEYLFRGLYNHQGSKVPAAAVVDDYEFYNALSAAKGIWTKPDHYAVVAGVRDHVRPMVTDVVNPLTGRIAKNRSTIRFAQPTYRNPGDETLYGYYNYLDFTAPFTSMYENDYTILVRFRHEGKICPESTQSSLFDFGYGWSGDCGLWVSLRGDDDNQYPYVYLGGAFATEFKATQNSQETRLSAGKWTDLVIARGGTAFAVYTLAEGGKICKQTATGHAASGTQKTSTWFRLATNSDHASTGSTNTVIATSAGRNNFRGSFARVALWKRRLTDDEVRAAMADDFAEGDVLRFGVANDSAQEFTGTNHLGNAAQAVSETDADLTTDWRFFANSLTPAKPSATVKFTVGADGFIATRRLAVKLTSASAPGATLSATLNGTALLTDAAAEPSATLMANVPLSVLTVGDNALVFTRTDMGTDPLSFDCFAIEGVAETDTGDYRGAKVADDIYASAWGWWKRPNDLNGDGKPTAQSMEFPNALYACEALDGHSIHKWSYDGHASAIQIQNQTVTYPAGGVTLSDEPCLYFAAPIWVSGDHNRYGRADLFKPVFPITNAANWAFTTRIKVKEWLAPEDTYNTVQVFGVGYGWTADTGVGVSLRGKAAESNNLYLAMANGYGNGELKGTCTLDEADRLSVGKWIGIAVVLSNGYERVYTFVEGGTKLVEQGLTDLRGCKIPSSSNLVLGLNGTTGSAGVDGDYPNQFRGWMHSCALWPRALNRDEVLRAFQYPQRPDLVTVGVADGTRREFKGASVDTWTPPANGDYAAARPKDLYADTSYTVNFTVPADQANRNQLFRLSTLEGSDPTAKISIELNGETVVNHPKSGPADVTEFLPDANGVYEIGVRRELVQAGAATLTVRYVSGTAPIAVDAISLGNGNRSIRVRTGLGGLILVR